jgi:hypothetical protein
MADKDKVVGKALYLELRSGLYALQVLITPDGLNAQGRVVPAMLYRRQLSHSHPRRAWKHYSLGKANHSADGVFESMPLAAASDFADSRFAMIAPTVDQVHRFKYQVYKTPLAVEVTSDDLDTVVKGGTPYKILARITRSRKAAGFGELIPSPSSSS